MEARLEIAAASHIGLVRQRNEDCVGVASDILDREEIRTWRLSASRAPIALVVADGVGGYPGGQLASRQAVSSTLARTAELTSTASIVTTLQNISAEISRRYAADPVNRDCSTTIAGLVIDPQAIRVFNLGDSRIYGLERDRMLQLSTDDVLARPGRGGRSHVLTQWLGGFGSNELDPHPVALPVDKGGRFLLCSDGLYDGLTDQRIHELAASGEVPSAAANLITAALEAGGHDNISLILCDIGG
jgi:PPM family protein phosphatase